MDVEGNFLDGRSKAGCACVIPCPQAATSLHDEPRRNESACGKPAMVLDVVNVVENRPAVLRRHQRPPGAC